MKRRYCIAAALVLAGCARPPRAPESLLPEAAGGSWQRKSLHAIPPTAPTVTRAFEADYDGSGRLTVDLYETRASGNAFEMTQHWREAANTVVFDKGNYFVVIKWQQADRAALNRFVRDMQKNLEP